MSDPADPAASAPTPRRFAARPPRPRRPWTNAEVPPSLQKIMNEVVYGDDTAPPAAPLQNATNGYAGAPVPEAPAGGAAAASADAAVANDAGLQNATTLACAPPQSAPQLAPPHPAASSGAAV